MQVRGIGFSKVLGLIIEGTSNSTYKFCRRIGMDIVSSDSISNCKTRRLPFEFLAVEMQGLRRCQTEDYFSLK